MRTASKTPVIGRFRAITRGDILLSLECTLKCGRSGLVSPVTNLVPPRMACHQGSSIVSQQGQLVGAVFSPSLTDGTGTSSQRGMDSLGRRSGIPFERDSGRTNASSHISALAAKVSSISNVGQRFTQEKH